MLTVVYDTHSGILDVITNIVAADANKSDGIITSEDEYNAVCYSSLLVLCDTL